MGTIVPALKGPVADQEPRAMWREVWAARPASSEEVGELWGSCSPLLVSLAQDASSYRLLHPAQALSSRKPALTMGLPTLLFLGTPAALVLSSESRAAAVFIVSVFAAKGPSVQSVCVASGARPPSHIPPVPQLPHARQGHTDLPDAPVWGFFVCGPQAEPLRKP